jgi:hypothetical protein
VERREDGILILDLTLERSTAKVLVILAISHARLQALSRRKDGCCLGHQDVVVVALEVLERSSGEVIAHTWSSRKGAGCVFGRSWRTAAAI